MKISEFFEQDFGKARIKKGFEAAYVAALAGPGIGQGEFRLGAAIAHNTDIKAVGFNQYKTHPKLAERTAWPCLHAETNAIFKCGTDNIEEWWTMYVLRIKRNGDIGLAKPCDICQEFIRDVNLFTYFTTEDGYDILNNLE